MSLYVFDFDGVLFDTAGECLAIAYETVRRSPELKFADPWRDLREPAPDLAAAFVRNRYLVGPPWQYAVLLECLATASLPSSTAGFLALAGARREALAGFTERYFAVRGELATHPSWLASVRPYEAPARVFRSLVSRGRAAILSTRDERSIAAFVAHHLDVDVGRCLLPRAGAREKWELLLDVAAQRGLPPDRVFFVDDYLHHALPAHQRGIASHLATWGYLGPEDRAAAAAAGLPCLDTGTLEDALRNHEENRT